MAIKIPYSFDAKDIPESPDMFLSRWINPNDWDSVYVLYKRQEAEKCFFGRKTRYVAIGVEYVASHWGIQAATTGMSDYVCKINQQFDCVFLKLDHEKASSKFKYDVETHVIKKWSFSFECDKNLNLQRYSDHIPYETN